MRTALVLGTFLLPAAAGADPLARGSVDFGAPVGRAEVAVEARDGALRASVGDLALSLGAAPRGALSASIEEVRIADGRHLARVVVRGEGPLAREALLGSGAGARAGIVVIWQGDTGLAGDPGERSGLELSLDDWSDDALPDPVVAYRAEQVRLCGSKRALLQPRAFNPQKRAFQPVALNRHRGSEPAAAIATFDSPGPTKAPLVRVATFVSSSVVRVEGGRVDVTAPAAMADGNPDTAWWAANAGDFVTATVTAPVAIRAIAVTPAVEPAQGRRGNPARMRSLLVSTEAGVHRVAVPADQRARPGAPFWFLLPQPVRTSCVSLALGESIPGRGEVRNQTGIAEVAVYTDLDFGEGLEALVADLGSDERADDAERVLAQLGREALELIEPALGSDSAIVRRRTARVLGRIREIRSASSLVRLLGDEDDDVRDEARRALAGLGPVARDALLEAMRGEPGPARAGAATVVGQWRSAEALDTLVAEAGRGGTEDRRAIRLAIRAGLAAAPEEGLALVRARLASDLPADARIDLLRALDLSDAAARTLAGENLAPLFTGAASFPVRYHLVHIAAELCAVTAGDLEEPLGRILADDEDEILRAEAAWALGHCRSDVTDRIEAALRDPAPRVRRAAAEAFRDRRRIPRRSLRRVFTGDFWPMVRAAALGALTSDPRSLADEDLVGAMADGSLAVRRAAVASVAKMGRRSVWEAVVERMEDGEEDARLRAEAATTLGTVCARDAAEALAERVRRALQPMSDPDMRIGEAALRALVRLGGQPRDEARRLAEEEGTPDYLKAAVRIAMRGRSCPPPDGEADGR